ncbi:MAG: CopG family transcriptional regulator [Firmicutes bacterium]|nr:CopG family transcriptional regulator [Bacillota bacterium]
MENRVAVIGIIVQQRENAAQRVNAVLSEHGDIIVGRMGIPYKERGLSVISLIVDGTTDEIGALTGKLGNIPSVRVKSAITL